MPTDGSFIMKGTNLNQKWKHWNEASEEYLAQKEGKTGEEYYGRGRPVQYVKNTISAPQDKSDGSAITSELRMQQKKLSRMKKYNILVRKGREHTEEGVRLKKLTFNCTMDDITKQEEIVAKLRDNIKTERSQRWRHWADNSWAHKKKDIYRWIKGSKSAGPLIVIPGGSAQIADRLKEAEKAWG
eukprot:1938297-Heterocapsa_arctica.AAC.1